MVFCSLGQNIVLSFSEVVIITHCAFRAWSTKEASTLGIVDLEKASHWVQFIGLYHLPATDLFFLKIQKAIQWFLLCSYQSFKTAITTWLYSSLRANFALERHKVFCRAEHSLKALGGRKHLLKEFNWEKQRSLDRAAWVQRHRF